MSLMTDSVPTSCICGKLTSPLHPPTWSPQCIEEMENKNLKGLFNLIRKESKDVRSEIQALERSVALLTVAIKGYGQSLGSQVEVLACLTRVEYLLNGKFQKPDTNSGTNVSQRLGDHESALLRSLLQSSGKVDDAKDILRVSIDVQDEDSTDRRDFTPASSGISTPSDGDVFQEPIIPYSSSQSKDIHAEAQRARQERREVFPACQGASSAYNNLVEQRLDAMSIGIEQLMEGQREVMASLRGLVGRESLKDDSERSPVVVPPPRKVGRKVVGYVYDDGDGTP